MRHVCEYCELSVNNYTGRLYIFVSLFSDTDVCLLISSRSAGFALEKY